MLLLSLFNAETQFFLFQLCNSAFPFLFLWMRLLYSPSGISGIYLHEDILIAVCLYISVPLSLFLSHIPARQHNRCPRPASLSGSVAIATAAMGNTVFLPSASGSRTKRHVRNHIERLVLRTTLPVTYIMRPNRNPRRLRDSDARGVHSIFARHQSERVK